MKRRKQENPAMTALVGLYNDPELRAMLRRTDAFKAWDGKYEGKSYKDYQQIVWDFVFPWKDNLHPSGVWVLYTNLAMDMSCYA